MQPTMVPSDDDLGPRDHLAITGADAGTYLQSQVSQDVQPLEIGDATWSLILTPAGKVVGLVRIRREQHDRYLLDVDAGYGDLVAARLNQFKIRVDVDIIVEPAPEGRIDSDPASERRRIEAMWPRMGHEIISGETIPAGLGLNEIAVSFTKGCYPGQELVERMDSRNAGAPRTLQLFEVDAGAAPGDPVLDAAGNEIGQFTSVADGKALAWVKRIHAESSGVDGADEVSRDQAGS